MDVRRTALRPSWRRLSFLVRDLAALAWRYRSGLLALALASLLPLSLRFLHMAENGYAFRAYDWAGVVGDLCIGAAAALLLAAAFRTSLFLFVPGLLLWLGLNAGYYEFLREYGSSYFLIHAGEMLHWTFLKGSGTQMAHPWLIVVAALVVGGGAAWFAVASRSVGRGYLIAAALAVAVVVEFFPGSVQAPDWRQSNFVSANVRDVFSRVLKREVASTAHAASSALLADFLRADLSGKPILSGSGKRNIIMVFVEGLAGGHIASVAEAHGTVSSLNLPKLDRTARANLVYSTFIAHQKQSNRGMYAALCGAYPHLAAAVPEMTEIASGIPIDCLPAVLRANGYETLFMKAADSSYMDMGRFMLKIGFDRAFGEEGFPKKYPRNNWGLDDWSLYEGSLTEIEALAGGERPFFVSLFTSGTHHPYHIPDSFLGQPDAPARDRAWAFADEALDRFLVTLKKRGLLENTLVIVTSDEASLVRDAAGSKEDPLSGLTENWGLIVAIAPEGARGRVDELFQQADIPLSVLDYLGLGDQGGNFIGHSMFRTYDADRRVYFANIYKNRTYEYVENDELLVCPETLDGCRKYDVSRGKLFGPDLPALAEPGEASPMLRAVQAHSMLSPLPPPDIN